MEDDDDLFMDDDDTALEIQRKLYEQSRIQQEDNKNNSRLTLSKVLYTVERFLKNTTSKYKVIGGRAVTAWLNPEHQGLSNTEKEYIQSTDWDITVYGDDTVAKQFRDQLNSYLSKELHTSFDERSSLTTDNGARIYQIGIPEGSDSTEWIIDVHGEKFDRAVLLSGIWYSNLKDLIADIDYALEHIPGEKLTKRWTRKDMLQKAIRDISRFNRVVYNQLCEECRKTNRETLTGFNLNCTEILSVCRK